MDLLNYWPFAAVNQKLDALMTGQTLITKAQQDQATMIAAIFSKLGVIMTALTELKGLATTAFAENRESLNKALDKIDELKDKVPDPSDQQIVEDVASLLRNQIAVNDEFQARLNPPAPDPEPAPEPEPELEL